MRNSRDIEQAIESHSDTVWRICVLHFSERADAQDAFQDTFLKYAISGDDTTAQFASYLCRFAKHPNIEYLIKGGFAYIVKAILQGGHSIYINYRSNDLKKMLRLNREEINLLKNGTRAAAAAKPPKLALRVSRKPEAVLLAVSDNGPRLTDEAFERLHHASDSTDPEGLGLGLSIVRGIADAHSAKLSVRRLPGRGIEFALQFDPDPEQHTDSQENSHDGKPAGTDC